MVHGVLEKDGLFSVGKQNWNKIIQGFSFARNFSLFYIGHSLSWILCLVVGTTINKELGKRELLVTGKTSEIIRKLGT